MYHSLSSDRAQRLLRGMPADQLARRMAETFRVLADPTRVRMLYFLSRAELCVHDLAQLLGVSQPAASHHLRILRMQGLVRTRRQGKAVYYALDDRHVVELFRCALDHVTHTAPDSGGG